MKNEVILEVKNLRTGFETPKGLVAAVDDISFQVRRGQTLGVVGESGCGKSVTSLSIMRLIPMPPGKIMGGEIFFHGEDLLKASPERMRELRGNKISMIFQEPMTSLNPVFTIGFQISEVFLLHQKISKKEAREQSIEMLKLVGIPSPEKRIDDYPHQLSGGMRQRVMIAMALACKPDVLIADEPTTALDVTIQAQILELMKKLQSDLGMGIILITHDLGVIAEVATDVCVMYAGRVVEQGNVRQIFKNPKHPYTRGLLESIPSVVGPGGRLNTIPGLVPSLLDLPPGCRFRERCTFAEARCAETDPRLREIEASHGIACVRDI